MGNAASSASTAALRGGACAVRHRDQPAHGYHYDRIVKGEDEFEEGVADGVRMTMLPAGAADAAWAAWTDGSDAEEAAVARGGASVFVPDAVSRTDVAALFVHGGAFEGYSPVTGGYDRFASRVAVGTGLVVTCPDHPLSGEGREFKAPQIIRGLVKDVEWLMNFDPVTSQQRKEPADIILLGDSSGANQATSVLLQIAREHKELLPRIRGLILVSPWWDLTCGGHTYVSNAFSEETHTGDVAFRLPPDENREDFRGYALRYAGSEELLKDAVFSPYWLSRGADEQVLASLEAARVPIWACIGAAETLMGEVLDFAQRLRGRLPMEVWLHEAMFHDWLLYTSHGGKFESKEAAYRNIFDFVGRVLQPQVTLKEGIHFHIDPW